MSPDIAGRITMFSTQAQRCQRRLHAYARWIVGEYPRRRNCSMMRSRTTLLAGDSTGCGTSSRRRSVRIANARETGGPGGGPFSLMAVIVTIVARTAISATLASPLRSDVVEVVNAQGHSVTHRHD